MSIIGAVRGLIDLTVDTVEGLLYAIFDFDRQADELWGIGLREFAEGKRESTDWLVEKEAEEEVGEPCTCSDVFRPGIHRFNCSKSSSVAGPSPEAADDRRGGSVPNQDVEPPRFPNLLSVDITPADLDFAAWAVKKFSDECGDDLSLMSHSNLEGLARRLERAAQQLKKVFDAAN